MNISEGRDRIRNQLNYYRIRFWSLLCLIGIGVMINIVLWIRHPTYVMPKGSIYQITFRFNPRRYALSRDIPAENAQSLPDREFSTSVSGSLLREILGAEDAQKLIDNNSSVSISRSLTIVRCEDLFDEVRLAEGAYQVRWEYPCCEILTHNNGPFILRLQERAVEDVLVRRGEYKKSEILFYYDRAGGHPSPRIISNALSRSIVEAVRSDHAMMEQLRKVSEMLNNVK